MNRCSIEYKITWQYSEVFSKLRFFFPFPSSPSTLNGNGSKSWQSWLESKRFNEEKNQRRATNVIMHPPRQAFWGYIWRHTVEKSQTNAANVIMHLLVQTFWGDIWKRTVEKSQTNATNVTMLLLLKTIWGSIWKRTVEKNWTNATSVTLPLLGWAI